MQLRKNGATVLAEVQAIGLATVAMEQQVTAIAVLAAGDYIELVATQGSGGTLDAQNVSTWAPTMSMTFIGT